MKGKIPVLITNLKMRVEAEMNKLDRGYPTHDEF